MIFMALIFLQFSVAQDFISGRYVSDSGSEMELFCIYSTLGQSASLEGWYSPNQGNVSGTYTLSGQSTGCGSSVQLSFSVAWRNPTTNHHSATSWVAQAILDGSGNSVSLYSFWLMTSGNTENNWQGNSIGTNWFFYSAKTTSGI